MADAEFVAPWIKKADNDIKSARHLAENMHPLPAEIICFHCQQAAEKYLKAYIVYNDQEPPITHDLIELAKLCNNFNGDFSLLSPQCEYLSSFAVRTRYPGTNDPEDEDVKIALAYAGRIIELVQSKMPMLFNLTP